MAYTDEQLKQLEKAAARIHQVQEESENNLFNLQVQHLNLIADLKVAKAKSVKDFQQQAVNDLLSAELAAQNKINAALANRLNKRKKDELQMQAEIQAKIISMGYATDKKQAAVLKKQYTAEANEKIKAENAARKKAGKKPLSPEEKKQIRDKAKKEADEALKQGQKLQASMTKQANAQAAHKRGKELTGVLSSKDASWEEKKAAAKQLMKDPSALVSAISDFAKQLEGSINDIAGKKGAIDTRLQGSKNKTYAGSYWDRMLKDVTGVAGVSPFIKQSTLNSNIEKFVGQGIAFDVEQRAFLQTISEKIATTFNAADSSLLRLVKIQQQDTTASRLGMESALTAFLNNMYETTEYMQSLATSVRANLVEAQSLMSGAAGVELEYQVQKWLGSMSSVGMSDAAVQSLSQAVGQLAAGKVESITQGGAGNLLVMAANRAGIPISDILANGLDANNTNKLMQAMIDYMAGMYTDSRDSKVVQQQLASVFGVSASDLKAAMNLSSSSRQVAGNNLTNKGMLGQLQSMYNSMYKRTSMGEMLGNLKDNMMYTMASGIASSPALYGLYTASGLLDSIAGGIALPDIKVMGSGVNLQTTVADLMRVGALGGSLISGGISMLSGLARGGGNGLKAMGIDMTGNGGWVSRGTGAGLRTETSGFSTTESGSYAGNSDSGDVQAATLNGAQDDANQQYVEAQESEDADVKNRVIDEHVVQIYQLLDSVINGTRAIRTISALSEGMGAWH